MADTELGPYRLLAELGAGGMGTVYRAEGPDGGAVALKVIHPHLVGQERFRARFQREVEVGQRIRHPNVVATLDAGEAETAGKEALYLAMELVEGQTLRELGEELGRVPEDLCLHIGREVARALVAIHAAGVFHRDLKPENVLITPANEVKVMDLGVALLADESLRLSRTGVFVGSVLYAAPEQFGDGDADARADLYTLGLLLYELATGEHPFRSDDVAAVIRAQIHTPPRPPAELNPQLSPFLEEVVTTLLAKDREQRFDSAADVLAVLTEKERSAWWRERAEALRAEFARPLRRIRIPRETSLHGRDEELERLDAAFGIVRGGDGRVVLVEGEAGIGKTRLVDEFVERARRAGEEIHFLFGSYPPGGAATASGALSTAYREFFGGGQGLAGRLEGYLKETPGLVPAFAALLLGAPPPAGVAPLSHDALLRVFVLATQALAAERPTIVVIEDLHLAPDAGRAIFAALAAAVPEHRILLVGTTRPGLPERWVAGVDRLPQTSRLRLRRLTPKELGRLLVELFHSERLAGELGWAVATKSDGNPFFVFELVRSLREDKQIARAADGTWVKTGLIKDISVPSSVLDLVEARISELDETDKDMLEVASCCGFEFDPLLVADALGLEQIPAMKRLAHLEKRHRLVRAAGRSYVFDHHQVQEALYRGMPVLLREPYHAQLGEALERRHGAAEREPGALDGALAVDLCEHYLRGAQGDKATRYLAAALQHLTDGYLHASAVELTDRALAVPGLLEGKARLEILLRKSAALELQGRHREDRATLEEALALADALDDPGLRGRVRNQLGRLCIWTSESDAARTWLSEARDLARRAGDRRLESAAAGNLGIVFYRARRFDEAVPLFERGFETARELSDKRGMAVGTLNLGNVHWCRGEFEEARAHYERYRDLSREIGYREGEALAAGNLGNVLLSLGRLAEARACYEEVLALAGAIGDRHKTVLFASSLGVLETLLGRFAHARALLEQALAAAREIGMPREEATALNGLADVAEQEGDLAEARRRFGEAIAAYRTIGEQEGLAGAEYALGRIELADGHESTAARHLRDALDIMRELDLPGLELVCRAALARLPGGDAAAAERLLAAQGARFSALQRMQANYLLWQATGDRGHLAEAHGLLEEMTGHAPPEDRARMGERHRLLRAILADWDRPPA